MGFGTPKRFFSFCLLTFAAVFGSAGQAAADNLHLIDSRPGGYAIYRSGKPSADDFKQWCKIGIQEVYVLSGNADTNEDKFSHLCPSIKVLASEAQDTEKMPDDRAFALFDSWVQDAMAKNKKILFRCNCGCHRTGRLAAYYQMKYQNLTADDAITLMNTYGSLMMFHPQLPRQVRELEARIKKERELKTTQESQPAGLAARDSSQPAQPAAPPLAEGERKITGSKN